MPPTYLPTYLPHLSPLRFPLSLPPYLPAFLLAPHLPTYQVGIYDYSTSRCYFFTPSAFLPSRM
eukprot:4939476-Pleurochrysis_carterae.AAC.2